MQEEQQFRVEGPDEENEDNLEPPFVITVQGS